MTETIRHPHLPRLTDDYIYDYGRVRQVVPTTPNLGPEQLISALPSLATALPH